MPWYAAWRITQLVGGKVRFVRASSGHIAGIINHPAGGKGAFWVNDTQPPSATPEAWLEGSTRHNGSWWTDWLAWRSASARARRWHRHPWAARRIRRSQMRPALTSLRSRPLGAGSDQYWACRLAGPLVGMVQISKAPG